MAARSKGAKGPKVGSEVQPRVKLVALKLRLDPETVQVLKVESLGRGCSISHLIGEIVRTTPRQFALHRLGSKVSSDPQAPSLRAVPVVPELPGSTGAHGADSSAA